MMAGSPVWAQADTDSTTTLESDAPQQRPWADGVSKEDQRAAIELFEAGNALLADSLFIKAADQYREALQHWDHPAIHYNLALALLNLDQPLEVYHALEKAMAYGPAPLDIDKFERARSYQQLVLKQLASIEVICNEPGAKMTMDGKDILVGPGRYKALVRVGQHNFIATKRGYLPTNETRTFEPGEEATIELVLFTEADKTLRVRRWSGWKPWAMVGAGVGVGLLGGSMHYLSQQSFAEFDELVDTKCEQDDEPGCQPGEIPTDARDRGRLQQKIAIASYATAGAVLTTGFILVYLNRERVIRTDVVEDSAKMTITPVVSPDIAGVTAHFRF